MINTEYTKGIVVFIDISGFKEKVKNSNLKKLVPILEYINAYNSKDGVNSAFIMRDLLLIKDISDGEIKEIEKDVNVSQFSDSIVITIPCSENNKRIRLQAIIDFVAYLTYKLAMSKFFIRGGICVGDFYHKDNIFVGPAIIDAVELEKKANYPRVILSEDFKINIKDLNFLKTEDDICYVNWLKYIKEKRKVYEQDNLPVIKSYVEDNLQLNREILNYNKSVIDKYEWLKKEIGLEI